MNLLRKVALAAMLAPPGMGASAAVIDFSNASLGTHTGYVEDGFVFDKVRVVSASCANKPKQNCAAENAFRETTLTRLGGGGFTVNSLWFSIVSAASPVKLVSDKGSVTLAVGDMLGGLAIQMAKGYAADLSRNGVFQNIGFLKIVDLTLGDPGTGHFKGNLRFDDLDVTEVAPVPLPAAGGLMLAGMGGFAMLRRRKRL